MSIWVGAGYCIHSIGEFQYLDYILVVYPLNPLEIGIETARHRPVIMPGVGGTTYLIAISRYGDASSLHCNLS